MSEDKKKDRYQIATDYHNRGYNCCQSVCFAFLDQVDLDEKTLFRVTEGLDTSRRLATSAEDTLCPAWPIS